MYEVAVMSQYLAGPRNGYLQNVLHMFKYLDIHSTPLIQI